MNALTKSEQARLVELETKIINGQKTFIEIGRALFEIKRTRLYRDKASTFEEYCRETFGWGERRANQICAAVGVWEQTKEAGKEPPENENQARQILADSKSKARLTFRNNCSETSTDSQQVTSKNAPCSEFGDGTYRGHSTSEFYTSGNGTPHETFRDDIDHADRISKSTPGDVAVALEVSEVYPKKITFEVLTRDEEVPLRVVFAEILVKRGKQKSAKLDVHGAIIQVCNAYKRVTGRTLSVKPMDAGQLRRLLESGITLDEFIQVGQKAWVSDSFLAKGQSHQLAMFVKHYGNIREEISNPQVPSQQSPKSFKELEREENKRRADTASKAAEDKRFNDVIAEGRQWIKKYANS